MHLICPRGIPFRGLGDTALCSSCHDGRSSAYRRPRGCRQPPRVRSGCRDPVVVRRLEHRTRPRSDCVQARADEPRPAAHLAGVRDPRSSRRTATRHQRSAATIRGARDARLRSTTSKGHRARAFRAGHGRGLSFVPDGPTQGSGSLRGMWPSIDGARGVSRRLTRHPAGACERATVSPRRDPCLAVPGAEGAADRRDRPGRRYLARGSPTMSLRWAATTVGGPMPSDRGPPIDDRR